MDDTKYSLVKYLSDHSGYRCGYCKSSSSNYSHGMHSYVLTAEQYQSLINRGWRRSGTYCYKPTMDKTCCPAYTIKCDALQVQLTKSQKKVMKRMNNFLISGITPQQKQQQQQQWQHNPDHDDGCGVESIPAAALQHLQQPRQEEPVELLQTATRLDAVAALGCGSSHMKEGSSAQVTASAGHSSSSAAGVSRSIDCSSPTEAKKIKISLPGSGADPTKPVCRKAKVLRLERRQAKLALQTASSNNQDHKVKPHDKNNVAKSLEEFINESMPENPAHTLELRLVRYSEADRQSLKVPHKLFKLYQKTVHRDTDQECNFATFHDFLIDSPLSEDKPMDGPSMGYGSFHQQYWLDGNKLIAVAVIDILPACVSSVYFFYDPEYSFLSLGTYSSLRELAFVRELHKQSAAIKEYYMGFYIHSCVKMQYKGRYSPSYLMCPETYTWHNIQQAAKKLDKARYSRLEDDPAKVDMETKDIFLDNVLMYLEQKVVRYSAYRRLPTNTRRVEELVKQYVQLVGQSAYKSLVLVSDN